MNVVLDDAEEVYTKETRTKKLGERVPLGPSPSRPAALLLTTAQGDCCSRARTSRSSSPPCSHNYWTTRLGARRRHGCSRLARVAALDGAS